MKSAIESGWKGSINGFIKNTDSHVEVSRIKLELDDSTAWVLCNLLHKTNLQKSVLGKDQIEPMLSLGAAIGRLIDHPSAKNPGS